LDVTSAQEPVQVSR